MPPLCRTPIRELAQLLGKGKLTCEALVRDAIAQRERYDSVFGAYHQWDDGTLLDSAIALDRQADKSTLGVSGIPASIKSVFGVAGYDCYAGTTQKLPASWARQGTAITHLRRSGVQLSGLTHAAELSVGGLGVNPHGKTPRNPWDDRQHRVPGGSSAGAASSIWQGSCAIALGTDTGGSVRVPASLAGLVGLKTSEARWPIDGVVPLASKFDTIGLMALRVDDVIPVVECLDQLAPDSAIRVSWQTATDLSLSDFRFMRASSLCWQDLDCGITEAIEQVLEELCLHGMRLAQHDDNLFAEAAKRRDNGPNTAAVELLALIERDCPELLRHLSLHVRQFLESAKSVTTAAYQQRLQSFVSWRAEVHNRMRDTDIIVLPTVRSSPPTMQQIMQREQYVHYSDYLLHNTVLPSLNGSSAITLPVGLDAVGMPVGLQLVARAGAECALLRAAQLIERQIGSVLERIGLPPLLNSAEP